MFSCSRLKRGVFISDGTRELWKASEEQNHMVRARSSGSPGRRFGVNGGAEAGDRGYACIHSFIHSRNVKGSQSVFQSPLIYATGNGRAPSICPACTRG